MSGTDAGIENELAGNDKCDDNINKNGKERQYKVPRNYIEICSDKELNKEQPLFKIGGPLVRSFK